MAPLSNLGTVRFGVFSKRVGKWFWKGHELNNSNNDREMADSLNVAAAQTALLVWIRGEVYGHSYGGSIIDRAAVGILPMKRSPFASVMYCASLSSAE